MPPTGEANQKWVIAKQINFRKNFRLRVAQCTGYQGRVHCRFYYSFIKALMEVNISGFNDLTT